jgi:signal transduction histidine kinase
MSTIWSARNRAERMVAGGRLLLALVSLAITFIDPASWIFQQRIYLLLVAYTIFAAGVAVVIWFRPAAWDRTGVVTHFVDIASVSTLLFLTGGASSPFFAWFIFALFAAALRFGSRGTLWSAVVVSAIFITLGAGSFILPFIPVPELNEFIMRGVYLAVVAGLLFYLVRYQETLQQDLSALSYWPRPAESEPDRDLEMIVERAAEILLVPRVVLLIQRRSGEPEREAIWDRGRLTVSTQPLEGGPTLSGSFFSRDVQAEKPLVLALHRRSVRRIRTDPIPSELIERYGIGPVLAVRLDGASFTGWLLCLDRTDFTVEDLRLGEALRHHVISGIDDSRMRSRLEMAAVAGERMRLAQELHDGLLQSLAGVVHYLEVVHRMLDTEPEAARKKVTEIQGLLMEEQRNLRMFIQQLTPPAFRAERGLTNQLYELSERVQRQWGLQVDLRVHAVDDESVSHSLRGEIYNLTCEALFNVAKHALATAVRVRIEKEDDLVRIVVSDDGEGFPFLGKYRLEDLDQSNRGPLSIKRRIHSLRGRLEIDSTETGSTVDMRIPVGEGAA